MCMNDHFIEYIFLLFTFKVNFHLIYIYDYKKKMKGINVTGRALSNVMLFFKCIKELIKKVGRKIFAYINHRQITSVFWPDNFIK